MVLVAVGILGGVEGLSRRRIVNSWSLVLLAVLAFFLLLQAVPFLAGKKDRDRGERAADPPSESGS